MTQKLKIDFVSDIACPWCAVGLGGLEKALDAMKGEVTADISFHPFELNPNMAPGGQNSLEHISQKYGMEPAQIRANRDVIRERAARVGVVMNTSDASRSPESSDPAIRSPGGSACNTASAVATRSSRRATRRITM